MLNMKSACIMVLPRHRPPLGEAKNAALIEPGFRVFSCKWRWFIMKGLFRYRVYGNGVSSFSTVSAKI
jgi:hypothetical protein